MSKSSRVSFSLAPLVHLYKRRVALSHSEPQSPVFECQTPAFVCPAPPKNVIEPPSEQSQQPKPTLNLTGCSFLNFEQYRAEPSPLPPLPPPLNLFGIGLSISVPKHREETEEVPTYDMSPLSPSAHDEFKAQRAHEKEACALALAQALSHFHLSVTPPWQRTPASARSAATPSISPLNLTPRPDFPLLPLLPLLPMSPENSFTGLDELAAKQQAE
jgi:hypothetical protein